MKFGELLKAARQYKGMTQAELARKVGMTQSAVHQFEDTKRRGGGTPKMDTINKFADALSISPSELIPEFAEQSIPISEGVRIDMDKEEKLKEMDKKVARERIDGLIFTMEHAQVAMVMNADLACELWLDGNDVNVIKKALELYREAIDNG